MALISESFEVVILGTGLCESILAAAVARTGHKVLHLDRADTYGGRNANTQLHNFPALLKPPAAPSPDTVSDTDGKGDIAATSERLPLPSSEETAIYDNVIVSAFFADLADRLPVTAPAVKSATPAVSEASAGIDSTAAEASSDPARAAETTPAPPQTLTRLEEAVDDWRRCVKYQRRFELDTSVDLVFSRGELVDLLVSSNVARYLEFKALQRVYTYNEKGQLVPVPCSRTEVFSDKSVNVMEKRSLMKFVSECTGNATADASVSAQSAADAAPSTVPSAPIPTGSLQQELKTKKFTDRLYDYVLYSIALLDSTAEISYVEGVERIRRFLLSIGRYGNAPFLATVHGPSELAQAFCRLCAVYGGIYMLRRGIQCLEVDSTTKRAVGIVDDFGTHFNCSTVIASSDALCNRATAKRVQHMLKTIYITSKGLTADAAQLTFATVSPSKNGTQNTIFLYEFSSATEVCPAGLCLVYLYTNVTDGNVVAAQAAVDSVAHNLFSFLSTDEQLDDSERPVALWSVRYEESAYEASAALWPSNVHIVTPTGHGAAALDSAVTQAREIFNRLYPGEEFLPAAPNPEDIEWTADAVDPVNPAAVAEAEAETQAEPEAVAEDSEHGEKSQTGADNVQSPSSQAE